MRLKIHVNRGVYLHGGSSVSIMPYDERDKESGQFTPEFPDKNFLDAVDS